jgi:3-dehydroquinate dehydratase
VIEITYASNITDQKNLGGGVEAVERMRTANRTGNMAKLAVKIERLQDVPRPLTVSLTAQKEGMTFCEVPTGKLGSHLRSLMGTYGSSPLYGYVGKPISHGMVSVAKMKHALDEVHSWRKLKFTHL